MEILFFLTLVTKETIEIIGAILAGLASIGYALFWLIKNFPKRVKNIIGDHFLNEKEDHKKAARYRKKVSPRIRCLLTELAEETNADRALLLEYENGNSNLVGLPFLYASATIEVTKPSVSSAAQNYQRVNLLIISKFIEYMEEFGYLSFDSLEDIREKYPVLCGYLTPGGCKAGIFYTLYDESNSIGFIAITSLNTPFDKKLALPKIAEAAQKVGALLNYNKIKHELE